MPTLRHALLRLLNEHPLWRRLPVRVWGSVLRAPTGDRWLALVLHRLGWMGREDRAFLRTRVRPGMRVADIGANQGIYTLLLARLVGAGGSVRAFEPDDVLFAALSRNLAVNGAANVIPHHRALGSRGGVMTLYRSLVNSGDNRLSDSGRAHAHAAVEVTVARLDDLLVDGERLDFIKMDVQGWEMEALRGMTRVLDDPRYRELEIHLEYWPKGLREAGSDPREPLDYLTARGFTIYRPAGEMMTAVEDFDALTRPKPAHAYFNLCARRP